MISGTAQGQNEIYNYSQHKETISDEKPIYSKAGLICALAILVA